MHGYGCQGLRGLPRVACRMPTCRRFSSAAIAALEDWRNVSGVSKTRETSPDRTLIARTTLSRPTPRVDHIELPKVALHMVTTSPFFTSPRRAAFSALLPGTMSSMITLWEQMARHLGELRAKGSASARPRRRAPSARAIAQHQAQRLGNGDLPLSSARISLGAVLAKEHEHIGASAPRSRNARTSPQGLHRAGND